MTLIERSEVLGGPDRLLVVLSGAIKPMPQKKVLEIGRVILHRSSIMTEPACPCMWNLLIMLKWIANLL